MTELEFIQTTLDELAVFVRQKYAMRESLSITAKRDPNDLVTEVDLAVQEEIQRRIAQVFPGDAIVGEENGMTGFPSGSDTRAWVIDPIDGTQNFVRGLFPAYGISLGFAVGGIPVAGGVAVPGNGQLFLAERGEGAFRNGERIHVSAVDQISRVRAEVDFAGMVDRAATLRHFGPFVETVGQVRCHCAAVIGLCSIATGDMDAYVHVTLNPWDYAAGMIIVQESGGMITRLDGAPINLFDGGNGVLGSNGVIHDELSALAMKGAV
jgi:myo-inositol-1(or 4)-monophosphatase